VTLLESAEPFLSIAGQGHSPALVLVLERRDDLTEKKLIAKAEVGIISARYSHEVLGTVAHLWIQCLDALEGLRDIALRTFNCKNENRERLIGLLMPLLKSRTPLSLARVQKQLKNISYEIDLTMHQVSAKCYSDKTQIISFTSPLKFVCRAAKAGNNCLVEALGFRLEGISEF